MTGIAELLNLDIVTAVCSDFQNNEHFHHEKFNSENVIPGILALNTSVHNTEILPAIGMDKNILYFKYHQNMR